MIECGLWSPQVIPRVKGVFGRKSLDDVIPGSWYIVPLPSNREVRYRISLLLEVPSVWGFLGRIVVCLMCWVRLKLTLLLQWFGLVIVGMSWMRVRGRMEDPHVSEDWMRTPRGFHPPDSFCKSGGFWAVKDCVLLSSFPLNSMKVNGAFLLWALSQVSWGIPTQTTDF